VARAKCRTTVLGAEMADVGVGEGDPIVLLYGNPTSSFLWRDVLPALEGPGRCIVPDLVGNGRQRETARCGACALPLRRAP